MKTFNRPEMTEERLATIRRLIAENPDMCRTKLSVVLCELWQWQTADGKPKDMSCRDLLLSLDKSGKITLPESRTASNRTGHREIRHLAHDETPVVCGLKGLQPLRIEIVSSKAGFAEFKSYIDQYHYLGFDRSIGERMAYMVYSREDVALSCLLFGAAAWSCADRDKYIGWDKEQRRCNLSLMANNARFLVLPWVRAPFLASHVLSIVTRRINNDWGSKYGHGLVCLETFVERNRFAGTCLKAANWIKVGITTGRGRDGGHHNAILPTKDIHLYPLDKDYRKILRGEKQRRSVADGRYANGPRF